MKACPSNNVRLCKIPYQSFVPTGCSNDGKSWGLNRNSVLLETKVWLFQSYPDITDHFACIFVNSNFLVPLNLEIISFQCIFKAIIIEGCVHVSSVGKERKKR